MWRILSAACLVGLLASDNAVGADGEEMICASGPMETWASPQAVTRHLSTLIDKEFVLGVDKGCYEAEVILNATTMIDVYVDPISMKIMRIRTNGEGDS